MSHTTEWLSATSSISNLFVANNEVDEYDEHDADIILARRARSGSLSDQDLVHDHSGIEEAGYEVSLHAFCFIRIHSINNLR